MASKEEEKSSTAAEVRLSALQLDALQEVSTIGMGNATIAFSELIRGKVEIKLSKLELIPVDRIAGRLGQKNMLVTGIYLRMRGDINGTSLLFFSRESAIVLADILNEREPGTTNVLKEIDRSALGELGSILSASYLNSIADLLDLDVEISVPSVVFDIASAITYFVLLSSHDTIKYSLVSQAEFVSSENSIKGEFLFLLDEATIIKLLDSVYNKLKSSKGGGSA
jgi:chemotaxis protein CheC